MSSKPATQLHQQMGTLACKEKSVTEKEAIHKPLTVKNETVQVYLGENHLYSGSLYTFLLRILAHFPIVIQK